MNPPLEKLCRKIDYQFKSIGFLELALTHRSASSQHNERVEFLGDGVLNFIVAEALYHNYPNATEGELSRYRATLVNKDTLAEIAKELNLGDYIRLGSGELKSGGFRRASILADGLEALIAAVLLDTGFESAKNLILNLFKNKIAVVSEQKLKDPKSRLQEYLQSRKQNLPLYTVMSIDGDPHNQTFKIKCDIPELNIVVEGKGSSRRKAEQLAAESAMQLIEKAK